MDEHNRLLVGRASRENAADNMQCVCDTLVVKLSIKKVLNQELKRCFFRSPETISNINKVEKVFIENDHVKKKSWFTTIKLDFIHYLTLGVLGKLYINVKH